MPSGAAGMRFGVYYCGGMDWTFDDRPVGSMADVVATIPRGEYPAYAEAQVRELIDRYRPSVLWNDVAWPAEGRRLWPLFEHYYRQVPDGVVNDRWLPWSPLMRIAESGAGRRAIDALNLRQMRRDGGLVPPRPPHFDVRTPEYVVPPEVQATPWECVRGMDASFGYNAASRPEDFIARDELLWLVADVAAKGGNLLLNVGPRGIDAQIPDDQAVRLEWLGRFLQANREALVGTTPWVRAGASPPGGASVRYTARGDSVFAIVRRADGPITLGEVASTATTAVESLDGNPLRWSDGPSGLEVEPAGRRAGTEPRCIALRNVIARPSAAAS